MNAGETIGEEDSRRLDEAADWRVRLSEAGLESTVEFEEWLADPDNAAAWAQLDGPWQEVGALAATPEFMAARVNALRNAGRGGSRWSFSPFVRRLAAALGLIVLAGAGVGAFHWATAPDVYRTNFAERRVIELADGSTVSLDSGTELRVRYTEAERRLELRSGQARFQVARDAARPFTVTARDQRIIATGTAFNVDLLGPSVLVTLIEGRVTVLGGPPASAPDAIPAEAVVLSPGEQLHVTESATPTLIPVSITRATAWETGQLIFEDEPLAAAAARVSRYARRTIRTDAEAGEFRVSGVFRTGDDATFIEAVSSFLPVEARSEPDGAVVLQAVSRDRQ